MSRRPVLLYIPLLCGLVFFTALPSANAASCQETDSSDACQYAIETDSAAPDVSASKGLKLKAGVTDVFFNNYNAIAPSFLSNAGTRDLFVPQATELEFRSFFNAVADNNVEGVKANYAVAPTTFTAKPTVYEGCPFTPESVPAVRIPFDTTITVEDGPPIRENEGFRRGYVKIEYDFNDKPNKIKATSTEFVFSYARNDCTSDNEGTNLCNSVLYKNIKSYNFRAMKSAPRFYNWNMAAPEINDKLQLLVKSATGSLVASGAVTNCKAPQAPVIKGVCGISHSDSEPAANTLCARGNATSVTEEAASYGKKWTWSCMDTQGAGNQLDGTWVANSLAIPESSVECDSCQSKAHKVPVTSCSKTCDGGTQTVDWYDSCNNYETRTEEACNTQSCSCDPVTETEDRACPEGQVGSDQYTRTLNVGRTCGNNSAWTLSFANCAPKTIEVAAPGGISASTIAPYWNSYYFWATGFPYRGAMTPPGSIYMGVNLRCDYSGTAEDYPELSDALVAKIISTAQSAFPGQINTNVYAPINEGLETINTCSADPALWINKDITPSGWNGNSPYVEFWNTRPDRQSYINYFKAMTQGMSNYKEGYQYTDTQNCCGDSPSGWSWFNHFYNVIVTNYFGDRARAASTGSACQAPATSCSTPASFPKGQYRVNTAAPAGTSNRKRVILYTDCTPLLNGNPHTLQDPSQCILTPPHEPITCSALGNTYQVGQTAAEPNSCPGNVGNKVWRCDAVNPGVGQWTLYSGCPVTCYGADGRYYTPGQIGTEANSCPGNVGNKRWQCNGGGGWDLYQDCPVTCYTPVLNRYFTVGQTAAEPGSCPAPKPPRIWRCNSWGGWDLASNPCP